VKQPRIYPDLTQVVEEEAQANDDSKDDGDESIDKAGPRKPIIKARWPRIKGLTPTCQSTRIKERTATNPEGSVIKTPPLDIQTITPMQESSSSDDDEYISTLSFAHATNPGGKLTTTQLCLLQKWT
jgi:hypothetical protein